MAPGPANTSTLASPVKPAGSRRFELPTLDFKFGSLTDGTNIPPPLPSPIQEEPSPPKTPNVQDNGPNGHAKDTMQPSISESVVTSNGTAKPSPDDAPLSPAMSSRGSLRRLLSKSLLHTTYEEHGAVDGQGVSRPPSRTASVLTEDRKSKRGSGWFRRLRSSDGSNKRMSHQYEEVSKPLPAGPPPPMIPELRALGTQVDTSMGDDLFKEIK